MRYSWSGNTLSFTNFFEKVWNPCGGTFEAPAGEEALERLAEDFRSMRLEHRPFDVKVFGPDGGQVSFKAGSPFLLARFHESTVPNAVLARGAA